MGQGVLHICNAFLIIMFDNLLCEVLAWCDFSLFCHFVHSFFLSFIVAQFPEIEKVCKLFFNLHTLFYKLIQGGNLEVLRVLLCHSSISSQVYYRQLINADISCILGTSISPNIALFASFSKLLVAN